MRTSGTAIASLVFGILGWTILPVLGALVAVICGHLARSEIRRMPPGSMDGDGLAVAGLILGWIQIGIGIAVLAFFFGLAGLLVVFGGSH